MAVDNRFNLTGYCIYGSWSNIAKEMLAMLAIREGDLDTAKKLYGEILNTPELSDGLKLRIQDMLSVLDSANK